MRLDQLRARESDFDRALCATLGDYLRHRFGRRFEVEVNDGAGNWLEIPLVSALTVANPSAEVRRFLADTFRYTPRRRRAVPQFLAGSALASSLGVRHLARPSLRIEPHVPGAEQLAILPGNQRVRILDFARGSTVTIVRSGQDPEPTLSEAHYRLQRQGPFLPVLQVHRREPTYIEEPLIRGWTLPRLPPWLSRRRATRAAFAAMDPVWRSESSEVAGQDYGRELTGRINSRVGELALTGDLRAEMRLVGKRLGRRVDDLDVTLGRIHGDFQPGNIMVSKAPGDPKVIDWEYTGHRFCGYDAGVFGLGFRTTSSLPASLERFVLAPRPSPWFSALQRLAPDALRSTAGRYSIAALLVLEDLEWRLSDASHGRDHVDSAPLLRLLAGAKTLIQS